MVEGLGVRNGLSHSHVQNDLRQLGRLHGVLVAELLHKRRHHRLLVPLPEPRHRNRFLGLCRGLCRGLGRVNTSLFLCFLGRGLGFRRFAPRLCRGLLFFLLFFFFFFLFLPFFPF